MATNAPPDDTKPNTEEQYTAATHASNLRVQAERGGSADMLIAAGWSASRIGASLIRLHSEFEGQAKPKRLGRDAIKLLADTFKKEDDGKVQFDKETRLLPLDAAHRQAHEWYLHEMQMVFQQMKTLPEVRHQLVLWALKNEVAKPERHVAEVISWWLDHRCPVCEGRAKEHIIGTPSLSHKDCRACKGTGETKIPADYENGNYLRESKKMLRLINDCVKSAQASIRSRLQPMKVRKTTEKEAS